MVKALEAQAYMETVCYKCPTWEKCQGSNLEDCKQRDEETDKSQESRAETLIRGFAALNRGDCNKAEEYLKQSKTRK